MLEAIVVVALGCMSFALAWFEKPGWGWMMVLTFVAMCWMPAAKQVRRKSN